MRTHELRQTINDKIVAAISSGGLPPWRQPWSSSKNSGSPINVVSKRPYSGVNPMLLRIASERLGLQSRNWATFQQWQRLGGRVKRRPNHVRPGEWGTTIVYCAPVVKQEINPEDEDSETSKYRLLKSYTVFCVDQVDGYHLDHLRAGSDSITDVELQDRFDAADRVVSATGADICYGGNEAFYNTTHDFIQMPHKNRFALGEFVETLGHELVHWSEAPHRLNWDRSKPENSYALGELIAELGGCYFANELGLPVAERLDNHAAYLQHWLENMRGDPSFVFRAAKQASRAVDFIFSFSRSVEPEAESADELVQV